MIDTKTLKKFCKEDHRILKEPWSDKQYTYASNGSVLIRVPRIPEINENPLAPDPSKMFAKIEEIELCESTWYPVKKIKMPPMITCEDCDGKGNDFICPECDGEKTVEFENEYSRYDFECKSCDGTGEKDFCEICNGTGKRPPDIKPMAFHWASFDQKLLALLSLLPGCKLGLNAFSALGSCPYPFTFDGGDGAIMPLRA